MRRWLAALAVGTTVLCSASGTFARGNASLVLGGRLLDEGQWEPLEEQGAVGVMVDFGRKEWPIRLVAGAFVSSKDESEEFDFFGSTITSNAELTIAEVSFGVLKSWDRWEHVHPYVGGGASFVRVTSESRLSGMVVSPSSFDEHDESAGFYGQGGVFWRLGSRFNLGLDVRGLRLTDVFSGDANYNQVAFTLGWAWD